MKLFVVHSASPGAGTVPPFHTVFDDHYARRFLAHLRDEPGMCAGCGPDCDACRQARYDLDFSADIAGVHVVPAILRRILKTPEDYLPGEAPDFDVLVALHIHDEILMALAGFAGAHGAKALIAPIEGPDWVTNYTRRRMLELCAEAKIEFADPKPFCSLAPDPSRPHISAFIEHFRVGRPSLSLRQAEGLIEEARVVTSAPCGATYFVARNLEGLAATAEAVNAGIYKYWHGYPCTGSMEYDPEVEDTILHLGGDMHCRAGLEALGLSRMEAEAPRVHHVKTAFGTHVTPVLPTWGPTVPPQEVGERILGLLNDRSTITFGELNNLLDCGSTEIMMGVCHLSGRGLIQTRRGREMTLVRVSETKKPSTTEG